MSRSALVTVREPVTADFNAWRGRTRDDNVVARQLYDELALVTSWVTYDLTPGASPTA